MKILIIGGDSFVGKYLQDYLVKNNHFVVCTSRKYNSTMRYLDLNDLESLSFNHKEFDYCIILAGITNYDECEYNVLSKFINETQVPLLCFKLLKAEIFFTYISSNSIFGGEIYFPDESSIPNPKIQYSKQKYNAENKIKEFAINLNLSNNFNILRITKVLTINTNPIPQWIKHINSNLNVNAFEDLIFSPISIKYFVESMSVLINNKKYGTYHLSGLENLNYYQFCKQFIASYTNKNIPIIPVTSSSLGYNILFKPKFSALSMKKTALEFDLFPQKVESVIIDIVN